VVRQREGLGTAEREELEHWDWHRGCGLFIHFITQTLYCFCISVLAG
jgi:hypothetical protein